MNILSTVKERTHLAHELFVNIPTETLPAVINDINRIQYKQLGKGIILGAVVATVGIVVYAKVYVTTHHS